MSGLSRIAAAAAAVLLLGPFSIAAIAASPPAVDEPESAHLSRSHLRNGTSGKNTDMTVRAAPTEAVYESGAVGRTAFSMKKIRTYSGPRVDFADDATTPASSRFPSPPEAEMCRRWAVLSSGLEPTETVKQLAELPDWCVVVVTDNNGPTEHEQTGVKYLTPSDQEALPYRIAKLLPDNHLSRKNIGYVYAIHRGAEVIYDVDDGTTLMRPDDGVPHANVSSASEHELSFFSSVASTTALNPYPCFGAQGDTWPRGFPLTKIHGGQNPVMCDVTRGSEQDSSSFAGEGQAGTFGDRRRRRNVGVVQILANNEPDVDAIYRLTYPSGELPFSSDQESPAPLGSNGQLRAIPPSTFAPYNAQATLHYPVAYWGMLLPTSVHERVSDIWRSYFTQTLLPSAGAVAAFAPASVERRLDQAQQAKSSDKLLADFQAELPLYQQSGSLVEFLADYSRAFEDHGLSMPVAASMASRVEALAVTMFEYGIVGESHVTLTQAWLQDLRDSGHDLRENIEPKDSVGKTVPALDRALPNDGTPGAVVTQAVGRYLQSPQGVGDVPSVDGGLPHVLLVVAVVSVRPDRRDAIRKSWLTWGDDRVQLRFFTEMPLESDPNFRNVSVALEAESDAHGDLLLMDISPGMNFTIKLLWAMRWMSQHFKFDFFLRLDDDYFLCLRRLLDELDATLAAAPQEALPLKIYAGHRYCERLGQVRIDEAYLLLSEEIVVRSLSAPDLQCGRHAGMTVGWWLTKGNDLNSLGDVEWVNDYRIVHTANGFFNSHALYEGDSDPAYTDVCATFMGLHHAYSSLIPELWEAAKAKPGPGPDDERRGAALLRYVDDGKCRHVADGVHIDTFKTDRPQPCDGYVLKDDKSLQIHCGAEGC